MLKSNWIMSTISRGEKTKYLKFDHLESQRLLPWWFENGCEWQKSVHIRKWFLSFCGFIVSLNIAYFQDIFWAKLLPESFRPLRSRETNLPSHHHLKHFRRQRKSHKGQQFRQYSNNPLKKDINPKTNKILEVSTNFKDFKSFSHIFLNFAAFTKQKKEKHVGFTNGRNRRRDTKATVQPWEAPPKNTRCPWPCNRSTSWCFLAELSWSFVGRRTCSIFVVLSKKRLNILWLAEFCQKTWRIFVWLTTFWKKHIYKSSEQTETTNQNRSKNMNQNQP